MDLIRTLLFFLFFFCTSCTTIQFKIQQSKIKKLVGEQAEDSLLSSDLRRLYRDQGFKLLWEAEKQKKKLQEVLEKSKYEGLPAGTYTDKLLGVLEQHNSIRKSRIDFDISIQKDIELSKVYLQYLHDLTYGIVDPNFVQEDMQYNRRHERINFEKQAIEGLRPQHPSYIRLKRALRKLIKKQSFGEDSLEKIEKILINMERWRWLPTDLGETYIILNIANGQLSFVKQKKIVFTSRILVGKEFRMTPVLSSEIVKVVFNPTWLVPVTIFREDFLPKIKKDPKAFFENSDFLVLRNIKGTLKSTPYTKVNWDSVVVEEQKIYLKQKAGILNPLGRVKFIFPNNFDVYLHDTPNRSLFSEENFTQSSGCIRVEKPIKLARFLVNHTIDIQDYIDNGVTKSIELDVPIPIYIQYWTAWVGSKGKLTTVKDIYGRDAALKKALSEKGLF